MLRIKSICLGTNVENNCVFLQFYIIHALSMRIMLSRCLKEKILYFWGVFFFLNPFMSINCYKHMMACVSLFWKHISLNENWRGKKTKKKETTLSDIILFLFSRVHATDLEPLKIQVLQFQNGHPLTLKLIDSTTGKESTKFRIDENGFIYNKAVSLS